jgi:hypothetical protein
MLGISTHLNARHVLGNTTPECYFNHSTNKTFHNLTNGRSLPATATSILGMRMNLIPTPSWTPSPAKVEHSNDHFEHDIGLKVHFAGDDDNYGLKKIQKLRIKSTWRAPLPPGQIDLRIRKLSREIKHLLLRKQGKPNLNMFQKNMLRKICGNHDVIITHANKGLGPVGIKTTKYIRWALNDHLLDAITYTIVPKDQALWDAVQLYNDILLWTAIYSEEISPEAKKFIHCKLSDNLADPFGYFYLMIKLHELPITTCPVCSDCASLPHALGQWVDDQLQPIVKGQSTYFKNSMDLKKELDKITLPPNALIFMYDAVSMYTNIGMEECISQIKEYLWQAKTFHRFHHKHPQAIISAKALVMQNNRM